MGSEMCIRDRHKIVVGPSLLAPSCLLTGGRCNVTAKEEMILTWHRDKCDNIEQIPSTRIFCSQLAEENLLN